MIEKLEKCIKRYINDNLTKDWYDEEEFGDKINEIIDFINKKEKITVTIPKGEYNIWGNNPKEKGFTILENLTINETGLNRGYSDLSIKQKISKEFILKKELARVLFEFAQETNFDDKYNELIDKINTNFNL